MCIRDRLEKDLGLPLVATNDSHYLCEDDAHAQDVMLCIQTGKSIHDTARMKFDGTQFFVKNHDEMYRVFKDSPEVLTRTLDIAERCSLRLEKVATPFPQFDVPPGSTIDSYFVHVSREGFADVYKRQALCRSRPSTVVVTDRREAMADSPLTVVSVSYTHLDVYKRQLLITPQLPEYPKIARDVFMLLLDGKLRSRTETLKFLKPFAPPPPPPPPPPRRGRGPKAAAAPPPVAEVPGKPVKGKGKKGAGSLGAPAAAPVIAAMAKAKPEAVKEAPAKPVAHAKSAKRSTKSAKPKNKPSPRRAPTPGKKKTPAKKPKPKKKR